MGEHMIFMKDNWALRRIDRGFEFVTMSVWACCLFSWDESQPSLVDKTPVERIYK